MMTEASHSSPSSRPATKARARIVAALLLALSASVTAWLRPAQADTPWQLSVTPYLWAISVGGDAALGNASADLDVPFSDLIDELNFAVMGHLEARRDRWALFGDLTYSKLSADAGFGPVGVGPFQIGANTVGPFPAGPFAFDVDIDLLMLEGGVAYEARSWPTEGGRRGSFEVLAGARYNDIEIAVDFARARTVERSADWVDPFIGARLRTGLSPRWGLSLRADVGGFGVGSEFTWNVVAGATYQWGANRDLFLGYRALYQKYQDDGGRFPLEYEPLYHGPALAVQFRF